MVVLPGGSIDQVGSVQTVNKDQHGFAVIVAGAAVVAASHDDDDVEPMQSSEQREREIEEIVRFVPSSR